MHNVSLYSDGYPLNDLICEFGHLLNIQLKSLLDLLADLKFTCQLIPSAIISMKILQATDSRLGGQPFLGL